jgi:hypothetical protein
MYPLTPIARPKIAIGSLFLLLSWILLEKGETRKALMAPLFAAFHSVALWPSMLMATAVGALVAWRSRLLKKKEGLEILACLLASSLFLIGFYFLDGQSGREVPLSAYTVFRNLIKGLTYLLPQLALLIAVDRATEGAVSAWPSTWKALIGGCWLGSLLGLMLAGANPNGFQMMTVPLGGTVAVIFSILAVVLLAGLEKSGKGLMRFLLFLFLIQANTSFITISYATSDPFPEKDFRERCADLLDGQDVVRVASLDFTLDTTQVEHRLHLSLLGKHLLWNDRARVVLLNVSDFLIEPTESNRDRPFPSFCRERHLEWTPETLFLFLQTHSVDYLYVRSDKPLPSWLNNRVVSEVKNGPERLLRIEANDHL